MNMSITCLSCVTVTILFSDQVTVLFDSFTILSGFNSGDLPLCITVNAANNNCLDSGDAVLLEIQELSSPDEFPVDVSVAVDCGNSEVNVFDDDGKLNNTLMNTLKKFTS